MSLSENSRKTIAPTLVIGLGGTGLEVISRVRRLIEESYGKLQNFPIISFLHIDTDQNYKLGNPVMGGSPLESDEKYWSSVNYKNVHRIIEDPDSYSWYHEWLPDELKNRESLLVSQEGAGQVRACGRFSFFNNYKNIRELCTRSRNKLRGHDQFMSDTYQIKVDQRLNIFIVASLSGGTGSGMLIDFGYCLRHWFENEPLLETTAIIPSPDAFSNVISDLPIKENGYAALMELNYFSDDKTEFNARYELEESSRIKDKRPPYDYIYLVGKTNDAGVDIELETIREMMAQNIFLDLVSDFSSYKRSARDNIRKDTTGKDQPQNQRSYPRNFLSFGIASIEIPTHHIRRALASCLAQNLISYWQNDSAILPVDPEIEFTKKLEELSLKGKSLLDNLLQSSEGSLKAVLIGRIRKIQENINSNNWLECQSNLFKDEEGKINHFIDEFLNPNVVQEIEEPLSVNSPDERLHGEIMRIIYRNRQKIIDYRINSLNETMIEILTDRNKGVKYLQVFIQQSQDLLFSETSVLKKSAENPWKVLIKAHYEKYQEKIKAIEAIKNKKVLNKQSQVNKLWQEAKDSLEKFVQASLEYHSRMIAIQVINEIINYLQATSLLINKWQDNIQRFYRRFKKEENDQLDRAEALDLVGIKLFDRNKIDELYHYFISSFQNKDVLFNDLTTKVLELCKELKRKYGEDIDNFNLLDIHTIEPHQEYDFLQIIFQTTYDEVINLPSNHLLEKELDACNVFLKQYPNSEQQKAQIELLINRSEPLMKLNKDIPTSAGFQYKYEKRAGILGGENQVNNAQGEKIVNFLKRFCQSDEDIAPLSNREKHKILMVQEVGGYSLRCIEGMEQLRRAYQTWYAKRLKAEKDNLMGIKTEIRPTVHLQKDIIFWDLIPPTKDVEELVILCRAFDILFEKKINTKQSVIFYQGKNYEQLEDIPLATNWQQVIQVLQLADFQKQKQELEKQLNKRKEETNTRILWEYKMKLDKYLENRILYFSTESAPDYIREKNVINKFIADNNLLNLQEKQDDNKAFGFTSKTQEEAEQELIEHINKYKNAISYEALKIDIKDKAKKMNIEQNRVELILNKFFN